MPIEAIERNPIKTGVSLICEVSEITPLPNISGYTSIMILKFWVIDLREPNEIFLQIHPSKLSFKHSLGNLVFGINSIFMSCTLFMLNFKFSSLIKRHSLKFLVTI